jgi:hypothetical protein
MFKIVDIAVDQKDLKILIVLENGLSRWFGYNEIHIDGPMIFLKTQ